MTSSLSFCLVSRGAHSYLCKLQVFSLSTVGEDEEVSIKEVADAVVKAVGFEGDYSVRSPSTFV